MNQLKFKDRIKSLRRIRAGDLIENKKNWRKHPEEQVNAVRSVLSDIGFASACLVRETKDKKFELIDGHLRAGVAQDEKIPCLILDVTAKEADKLLATFDPITNMADADEIALEALIKSLDNESEEITELLNTIADENEIDLTEHAEGGLTEDDAVPEAPEKTITKPGDIWILGSHRLICGDCTDNETVELLMCDEVADMAFTSPPYNANAKFGSIASTQGELYEGDFTDNLDSDAYIQFAKAALNTCFKATSGFIFWNVNYNTKSRFEYLKQIEDHHTDLIEQICWKKSCVVPYHAGLRRMWEPIFVFRTSDIDYNIGTDFTVESNLWEVNNSGSQTGNHKGCFPVELPEMGINLVSEKTGIVFDPFGGTGTTLIACEKNGRKCYMMELGESYCDVIVKRWEEYTGRKATKQKKGK